MKESELGEKTAAPSTPLPRISCQLCRLWRTSCAFLYGKAQSWMLRVLCGRKSGFATVGVCDVLIFRCSLRPESSQEHLPTSIAGVLRLRAVNPLLGDRSVRRFAQRL